LRSIGGVYDEVEWDTIEYCVMLFFACAFINFSPQYLCLYGCSVARASEGNLTEIGRHTAGHQ